MDMLIQLGNKDVWVFDMSGVQDLPVVRAMTVLCYDTV